MPSTGIIQHTDEWHTFRKRGGPKNPFPCAVGASEAPIIMGLSPYLTVDQLWEQKLGIRPPQEETYIMKRGSDLEPDARELYEAIVGIPFPPDCFYKDGMPWITWSSDGFNKQHQRAIEIKLYGAKDFATVQNGEVPDKHRFQLVQAMSVVEVSKIDLVGYFCPQHCPRGKGDIAFVIFHQNPSDEGELLARARVFVECVRDGVLPSDVNIFKKRNVVDLGAAAMRRVEEAPVATIDGPALASEPPSAPVTPPEILEAVEAPVASLVGITSIQAASLGPIESVNIAAQWFSAREKWTKEASELEIVDQESADRGGVLLSDWTTVQRAVEKRGKELAAPYKAVSTAISDAVRAFVGPAEAVKASLSRRLGQFVGDQEERRREAVAAVATEIATGQPVNVTALMETSEVRSATGTATTPEVVLTITDESLVPRAFLSVDEKKLNALKRALDPAALSRTPVEVAPGITAHVEHKAKSTGRRKV